MSVVILCLLIAVVQGPERLDGQVVDASGAPVLASVHEGGPDGPVAATTDAHGRFSIDRERRTTTLTIVAPGFSPTTIPTSNGVGTPVRIVLQPASLSEQVTVTAGRRELRGADSPAAASVLPSSELLSMAALAPDDALRTTPGFTLFRRAPSRMANPTTQGVTLRGLSASGASRSLVLAGGVPLNDAFGGWVYWGRVPQAAIERIEVVRGGSSDLYGADAVGGVIHIIEADGGRQRARATLEGGSLGTSRASAYGSLGRGSTSISVAAERLDTEGAPVVSEAARGPIDTPAGVVHHSLVGRVAWRPSGGPSVDLRGQYFAEDRQNGTPIQTNDTNHRQVAITSSGNLAGGSWRVGGYGASQGYDQAFSAVSADRTSESITQRQRVPSEMVGGSGEWFRTLDRLTLVFGGDGRQVDGTTEEIRFVAGNPLPQTEAGGRQRTFAGFAQATYVFSPSWTLVGGGRVDHWSSTTGSERSDVYPSGRVAVTWRPGGDWSLRGSAYRAFRTPTLNELNRNFRAGDTLTLANDGLVREALTGAELSSLWSSSRWSWRATMFGTTLDDAITNVTISTTPTLVTRQRQNAATVRSLGFEVEADVRLDARFAVAGNITATRARFDGGTLDGLDVPQVPRYQSAVSLRFTDPHVLTASLQVRAIGQQFEDDRNTLPLSPVGIVDVYAGRRIARDLHAFVAVENVLDEEVPTGRTPILTVGLPRCVRVGVRYFWR
jgi:outer membrane receptor protein involved in Fe transport